MMTLVGLPRLRSGRAADGKARTALASYVEGCRAKVYASDVCVQCGKRLPANRTIDKRYCGQRCNNTALGQRQRRADLIKRLRGSSPRDVALHEQQRQRHRALACTRPLHKVFGSCVRNAAVS